VFGRGDYVDLDLLSRIEILRGPASALYGSDGLAGVVSFITKDPEDFLGSDDNFGARLRAQYSSADDSWSEGVSAAGRWGNWSAIGAYTRRDGHEQENQGDVAGEGSARTEPNPQDYESNAALARLVFEPSDANRFRLTLDYSDRQVITDVLTARAPASFPFPATFDFDAQDESERSRIAFDHVYTNEGGLIDRASWTVYHQSADIYEFHQDDRSTTDRIRISTFDNEISGATGQIESRFEAGGVDHHLTIGGDYSVTRQEGLRDGTFPSGEIFPTRPFPNTDFTLAGIFVQDEITLWDGTLTLFPSLRYDSYDLEAEADSLYTLPVSSQSDTRVTPRIGAVLWPSERFGLFFNYAQGFKAPAPTQVNQAFTNSSQGYTSIPNPDLEPETSETIEIGLRFRDIGALGATWSASVTGFSGEYEDFIEQLWVSGPPFGTGTVMNPTTFQFVNLGEVSINGYEARADGVWDNGFGLIAAVSYADGTQIENGVRAPLESIDPFKVVTGLTYDAEGGRWGGQLIGTYVGDKGPRETATGNFRPGDFTLLDVTAYWRLTDSATLRAGVFNVTDETYWWWSDVRGVLASSASVDAYTQPGTNFSASISYRF
jgi:hemoglobin/transferrin/lactoferrin receptor protein